ncbi:MAG: V-type ATP synthase subunit D [Gemmatimonadaceae bacterium]
MRLRTPPGRAGRLWLRDRLASARSAAELLDHKRRELESEQHRMQTILGRRARDWHSATIEARRWLGRVDATNGARAMQMAAVLERERAKVRLTWRQVMGVRYPTDFDVEIPPAPAVASLNGGAALVFALDASARAAKAAVAHAVARTALARIQADVQRTVRRLRALQLRAIPAHEEALRALEVQLDEQDREDAVNARWAADAAAATPPEKHH